MRVPVGAAELDVTVEGDPRAPVVILAHGFPDCPRSFRFQVPALVAAGFRCVVPAMRGYAPSTVAADGRYDAAALGGDLCALARHFSPDRPVRLIGHDWGSVAAYAATARAPELFSQVVNVSVPHARVAGPRFLRPSQLRRSWYMAFFQLRGVAERRVQKDDFALLERLWRDWSPGWSPAHSELDYVKNALRDPSNLSAALGYYRAMGHSESRALLLRKTRVPGLYVHGVGDGCIGVELADGIESAYASGARIERLLGGHFVHQENPADFNRVLMDFLGRP